MKTIESRKLLIICIVILGAVTVGITTFMFVARLERPLFFKGYLEYNIFIGDEIMEQEFELQYLSNAGDSRTVAGIEFPGRPDDKETFFANEFPEETAVERIGVYSLHTVRVTAQRLFDKENPDVTTVLKDARIQFDDGSTQKADLGEIRLCWNPAREEWMLDQIQSESSSDGTTKAVYQSEDEVTIVGLHCSPFVESEGKFEIKLNDIDMTDDKINGMKIAKGGSVKIQTFFQEPVDIAEKYKTYELRVMLTMKDSKGTEWEEPVDTIYSKPFDSNFWGLFRYHLSERWDREEL